MVSDALPLHRTSRALNVGWSYCKQMPLLACYGYAPQQSTYALATKYPYLWDVFSLCVWVRACLRLRYNEVMDVTRGADGDVLSRILIDVHSFTTHCNAERAKCHMQAGVASTHRRRR